MINMSISVFINNIIIHSIEYGWHYFTSLFISFHLTGYGFIIGGVILYIAGKKILAGVLNIIVIALIVIGIASVFNINLLSYL